MKSSYRRWYDNVIQLQRQDYRAIILISSVFESKVVIAIKGCFSKLSLYAFGQYFNQRNIILKNNLSILSKSLDRRKYETTICEGTSKLTKILLSNNLIPAFSLMYRLSKNRDRKLFASKYVNDMLKKLLHRRMTICFGCFKYSYHNYLKYLSSITKLSNLNYIYLMISKIKWSFIKLKDYTTEKRVVNLQLKIADSELKVTTLFRSLDLLFRRELLKSWKDLKSFYIVECVMKQFPDQRVNKTVIDGQIRSTSQALDAIDTIDKAATYVLKSDKHPPSIFKNPRISLAGMRMGHGTGKAVWDEIISEDSGDIHNEDIKRIVKTLNKEIKIFTTSQKPNV